METARLIIALLGGSFVAFIAILCIVLANPDKVQKWAVWIWQGARLVSKKAEYSYLAADVANQMNVNFSNHISDQLDGISIPPISIKWDNDSAAIASEVAGTLIVRMKPHADGDRAANILHASLAASSKIIIPCLRTQLRPEHSEGIDLQICRQFAEQMSGSAITRYREDILEPAIQREPKLLSVLEDFQNIKLGGLFVCVFLQELTKVAALNQIDRVTDIGVEAHEFLDFLLTVAARGPGDNIKLHFVGTRIKVTIMLVARSATRIKGIDPYRTRVTYELAKGIDTIYVMGTGANIPFIEEVVTAFDADMRLLKQRDKRIAINRNGERVMALIVPFEKNCSIAKDSYFKEIIKSNGISAGLKTPAIITDVQKTYVALDFAGAPGIIHSCNLSWYYIEDCRNEYKIGETIDVEVIDVNMLGFEINANRRICIQNPLEGYSDDDLLGQVVTMKVDGPSVSGSADALIGRTEEKNIPLRLYADEYDWGINRVDVFSVPSGCLVKAVVTRVVRDKGYLVVSKKRLTTDVWTVIRDRYPRDMKLSASISKIDDKGVFCELEPSIVGFVPSDEFKIAGLEYEDYQNNLRVGQKLFVVVSRVIAGDKERINLKLQANLKVRV